MVSRRGRLNWSNLDIHISDAVIEKQHCFTLREPLSQPLAENTIEEEEKTVQPPPPPAKRTWVPRKEVAEMRVENFVGNYMLTADEQKTIERKYKSPVKPTEHSKPLRLSTRLSCVRTPDISTRTTPICVGQHLLNVFVCHVESYSRVFVMFGDDYNRATKLFEDMNRCDELIQPTNIVYEPREKDFVAIHHEKKWFRGQCLSRKDADVHVLCIDSGVTMVCSAKALPPCCVECSLSGLPRTIAMASIPEAIHVECYELLYKDRYEAIVTRLEAVHRPTIVLYYGDLNVNDRLLGILKLI